MLNELLYLHHLIVHHSCVLLGVSLQTPHQVAHLTAGSELSQDLLLSKSVEWRWRPGPLFQLLVLAC